jgi:pimeloyl-ACP methyl ester carboxylesterase
VHGTSFVSEIWGEVASELATDYNVYALDRRGHGASYKPAADNYHFLDFARDVCAVAGALDLSDVFGVGHSAGATDLLLAAALLPGLFSRIFAIEPTVMDPRAKQVDVSQLSDESRTILRQVRSRRNIFESAATAIRHFRAVPEFASWSDSSLCAYVKHGFEQLPDGRIRLLCAPEIQVAMLRPILEAMEQIYAGDSRGSPFHLLSKIACPVSVSTAERSDAIYKEMASRAVAMIPIVSQWTFDAAGHCVAQETPAIVVKAIKAFKPGAN